MGILKPSIDSLRLVHLISPKLLIRLQNFSPCVRLRTSLDIINQLIDSGALDFTKEELMTIMRDAPDTLHALALQPTMGIPKPSIDLLRLVLISPK